MELAERLLLGGMVDNCEEFMKAHGFSRDEQSDGWVNATERLWISNQAAADCSNSEIVEAISCAVPRSEFHFYSKRALSRSSCRAILERLNVPELLPVQHVWGEAVDDVSSEADFRLNGNHG